MVPARPQGLIEHAQRSIWHGVRAHAMPKKQCLADGTPAGAEKAGYRAIMVTVDSPRTGNREADERSSLSLREDLEYSNLADLALARAVQTHDHNRSSASAPAQLFK